MAKASLVRIELTDDEVGDAVRDYLKMRGDTGELPEWAYVHELCEVSCYEERRPPDDPRGNTITIEFTRRETDHDRDRARDDAAGRR